jgi:NADPH:quinone reductase-like Zn-dependent oxidoreductase
VLEVREAKDPEPGAGEVRIRVHACGVNFADIMARMGLYPDAPPLPCVVGYEVGGVIDAVGSGVTTLAKGDRVIGMTRFGGYSDVVVVPVDQALQISDKVSLEAAASIPVNYLTAWLMLVKLGNVSAGDRVLVHAVAGGVGQAAVQICKWRGATVIGTASASKHARLKELGVEHVIDYRTEDFEAAVKQRVGSVDIVLDAVGGESFGKSYRVLSPMGRLFMFGISSFAPGETRSLIAALGGFLRMPKFRPPGLMNDNKGVHGVNLGHLWDQAEALRAMLDAVRERVEAGDFDPVVDASFDFEHAADAHRYIQDRKNFGKVLLKP